MKILLADDDADDRSLSAIAFKEVTIPHSVEYVNDGQELIDYLKVRENNKSELPDVILLDLNMPKKDGREALKEIKANPKLAHLRVIILSTSNSEADKKSTLESGAENYLVKPISLEELVEMFKAICEEIEK